jgi:N-acetylglucosaminyldiphosphoundecaprenol N-acetyl-beta-D-mannosaminyltransferase
MKKNILSLNISTGTYQSFLERIHTLAVAQTSSYVCVANVHMTMEAYWDPTFAAAVNGADMVTPDGMPLAKAMKLLYGIEQDRVAGMDLLPDLLKKAEEENLGVFFYGGTDEILQKTQTFVQAIYPNINQQAYYSPPFRALTAEEEISVIQRINESGAHLVFVALGCPKQEKWMASMKGRINTCMLGIGGALPVMIGMQKRAPKWMQKMSLEWLYRLIQEPRRLFKRYLITNILFLFFLFLQKIRIVRSSSKSA